jgi:hypothetical protein
MKFMVTFYFGSATTTVTMKAHGEEYGKPFEEFIRADIFSAMQKGIPYEIPHGGSSVVINTANLLFVAITEE